MSHILGGFLGGHYQIYQICHGGFGEVLLCRDTKNNRFCALKTIQEHHYRDLKVRRAFEKEVEIWVSLHSHQNIVRCYGLEVYESRQFIVLDWVYNSSSPQSDLRSYVKKTPITSKQSIQWIIDTCWGLFYAQNKHPGFVHGDIKPENLLLWGDSHKYAKLTDFGLVSFSQESKEGIAGSPFYMAPELWLGTSVDQRTDIYALGCVLFELLTGSPAFLCSTMEECKRKHLSYSIEDMHFGNTDERLKNIVIRCLEKDKTNRFQRIEEFLVALVELYKRLFDKPVFIAAPPLPFEEQLPRLDEIYLQLIPNISVLYDGTKSETLEPIAIVTFNKLNAEFSTFLELHDLEKASRIAHEMLSKYPKTAESYRCLGDLYTAKGDIEKAILQFTKALEIDPESAAAYDGRAKAEWEIEQHIEAIKDISKAVENSPLEASPLVTRGFWQALLGSFPKALKDLDSAIIMDAANPVAYANRGYVYVNIEEYEKAFKDYGSAVRINANYAPGYLGRSGMHMVLGNFELAIIDCMKVIDLGFCCGDAYWQMGMVYIKMEQDNNALECMKNAVKMGCNNAKQPLQLLLAKVAQKNNC